ncbi:alpha/beta fold hydrolase [Streptomyces sp. 6N223]|uniref:alpha/beta fold hydrolase n=1 Tax=Streptomyces sp. 6N223 TaxID=3457412 RepID=UPI003FD16300
MRTALPARRLTVAAVSAVVLVAASGCSGSDDDRPTDRSPSQAQSQEPNGPDESQGPPRDVPDAPALEPLPEEIPADLQAYYDQELEWGPCEGTGGAAGFECATLTVPMDYDNPDPATDLEIAVTRQEANDPGTRIGALLMNPGGPGSSAVDFAQSSASYIFPAEVRARYDMVGFDARGTGRSHPVECLDGAEMDEFVATDGTPDDEAETNELVDSMEGFAEACQEESGELLGHISTIETARDMDVLRAALGDEQLHYVGFSYGTKLGAVYSGLFPQNVGHLVLDAAMDPRLPTLDTDREQAGGFETAFRSFAEDCAGNADCPLGTEGADAASQRLKDFYTEVDAEPLPTNDPDRPLTESLADTGVAMALYAESMWPQLRDALSTAINDGDGSGLLELADTYYERTPDASYDTSAFAFPAISCLDSPAGTTSPDEVREVIDAYEEASPTFGADFAWATLQCAVWPVEPSGHPISIAASGAADIVVIGTTRDPATPYVWAQGLADQLESGILLTNDGDGHGAYATGNSCIDDAVNAYLLEGTSPEDGTQC